MNVSDERLNEIVHYHTLSDAEQLAYSGCVIDSSEELPMATELLALRTTVQQMRRILQSMVNDDAFTDLCAGIGEEPSWLKDSRALLAKMEGK